MMKTNCSYKRTATVGLTTTFLLFSGLALPSALAKKPGGKPGGGGVTVNPVPDVAPTPPVTYTRTEITWPNDIDPTTGKYVAGFEGCRILDVNNRGIAVGTVQRPKPVDAPADWLAFAYGVVNVMLDDQNSIEVDAEGRPVASDTWVGLNDLFSVALDYLNTSRSDGPWRIRIGWQINDAGLIACELLPADQDRQLSRSWAAYYGRDTTPQLIGVLDLAHLADPNADPTQALTLVDPANTDPDQDLNQLTSAGHLQVYNAYVDVADTVLGAYNDVYQFDGGSFSYERITPSEDYPYLDTSMDNHYDLRSFFSINSSLQTIHRDVNQGDFSPEIYRGAVGGSSELWWASANPVLRPMEIAEDGTLYVLAQSTVTKGRDKGLKQDQIYHLLSPTERTPLVDPEVDGSAAWVANPWRSVSSAPDGEEEILFQSTKTGELQIYKPNYGSRFVLDLQLPEGSTLQGYWDGPWISNPLNQGGGIESSPSGYYGGYIAYNTEFGQESVNFLRTYILTPSQ